MTSTTSAGPGSVLVARQPGRENSRELLQQSCAAFKFVRNQRHFKVHARITAIVSGGASNKWICKQLWHVSCFRPCFPELRFHHQGRIFIYIHGGRWRHDFKKTMKRTSYNEHGSLLCYNLGMGGPRSMTQKRQLNNYQIRVKKQLIYCSNLKCPQ